MAQEYKEHYNMHAYKNREYQDKSEFAYLVHDLLQFACILRNLECGRPVLDETI